MEHINHENHENLVLHVMDYFRFYIQTFHQTRTSFFGIDVPISWIYKTKINVEEIYPNVRTIISGHINRDENVPVYRTTRHTTSSVDLDWLFTKRYNENYFPLIKSYFLDNFVHADITYLGRYGFTSIMRIRETISNTQTLLRSLINKLVQRRKLKRRMQVYRSLFYRLDDDTIEEIQKFM